MTFFKEKFSDSDFALRYLRS